MDEENFEQYELSESFVGENITKFLIDGQKLILLFVEEEPIVIYYHKTKLPFKVIEAPPGIKGDTATNTSRGVKIESGTEVLAPLFIKEGESIIVNVETGQYCERYKE